MKALFLLLLFFLTVPAHNKAGALNIPEDRASYGGIDNGWYKAIVVYFSYSTYTKSTYKLDVKVEYDKVTVIDFGNNGYIHSGYNSDGYIYTGGYLSFDRDYDGNIISASTKVTLTTSSGTMVTFDIYIG